MQHLEEIDLGDADVAVRPVRVGGQRYVLRELSYDNEMKRLSVIRRNSLYNEDGRWTGFKEEFTQLDANRLTLTLCMFKNVGQNGEAVCGEAVGDDDVGGWPSEIVFKLTERVVDLCPTLRNLDTVDGLTKEIERLQKRLFELNGKDAAKNSPPATTEPSA